jgi:beta-glucosidase
VRRLAIIGPNARAFQTSGGGSSDAVPPYRVSPLDALRRLTRPRVAVRFEEGCSHLADLPTLSPDFCADRRGFRVEFFNNSTCSGRPAAARHDRWGLHLRVSGKPPAEGVRPHGFSVRWTARLRVPETTRYRFRVQTSGRAVLLLDGRARARGNAVAEVNLRKGRRYRLEVRFTAGRKPEPHSLYVRFGPSPDYQANTRIRRAADLARRSDAALVFVGMPARFESEGHDRPHMDLPGRQNELVRAVLRANPNTVVVVNAGAPVALPWADEANAVLFAYYPGMEGGNAIARILLGRINPSGRLPITLPRRYEDNPTFATYPGGREVRYGEGVFVGYRWYDAARIEPLFPFGHGLSYTTFAYGRIRAPRSVRPGRAFRVTVPVTNTGNRAGQEVVQLYVCDPQSSVPRPPQELRGFCKLRLGPGRTGRAVFELGERALSFYDPVAKRWVAEPGAFEIRVGPSSRDIRARHTFRLRA